VVLAILQFNCSILLKERIKMCHLPSKSKNFLGAVHTFYPTRHSLPSATTLATTVDSRIARKRKWNCVQYCLQTICITQPLAITRRLCALFYADICLLVYLRKRKVILLRVSCSVQAIKMWTRSTQESANLHEDSCSPDLT